MSYHFYFQNLFVIFHVCWLYLILQNFQNLFELIWSFILKTILFCWKGKRKKFGQKKGKPSPSPNWAKPTTPLACAASRSPHPARASPLTTQQAPRVSSLAQTAPSPLSSLRTPPVRPRHPLPRINYAARRSKNTQDDSSHQSGLNGL